MVVVLFDIDGTLIHSAGAGLAALRSAMTRVFGVADPASVEVTGRTDRAIARDLFRHHSLDDSQSNWALFRAGYLEHLQRELPARQGRVLPGVGSLLEELQRCNDVHLGLLTGNIQEGARLKLQHYRLFHHFAFGGYGDHHVDRDAVAAEALAASRQHRNAREAGAETVWVIGDTPLDVQCARAIGARVIAVATGSHTRQQLQDTNPDLLLDNLEDRSSLLGNLL